ncbi:unnamed protein product [Timema podura]|uniref:Uncharacterized protein n=1 Tax=Timema podura TaxID=61482 RepID=A0ABN7NM25_TIMPD|nr:unnamed protein product [Timema podura]
MKKVVPSCTPKPGPLGSSFKDVKPPLGSAANLPLLGPALTVSNFSDERGMVVHNKQDLSFRC